MGEPIILWDSQGNQVIRYSPSQARAEVEAGYLFTEYPALIPAPNAPKTVLPPLTPDDTQEVATVQPPKRRREKGDGGVL
jgi:hypothetical protein